MCGNGIRCLAKYVWGKKVKSEKLKVKSLTIETLSGIIHLEGKGSLIKVDMGEPVFEPEKIPVRICQELPPLNSLLDKGGHRGVYDEIINYPLQVDDRKFKITCISMGNPHAVIVVNDVASFPVSLYGPVIEKHGMFPKKTNVEIIQVLNRKNIKMRVWERGAGETMACGTGASASAVASALLGLSDRKVTVYLLGGKLVIEWAKNNHVYMTGPAVEVFEGTLNI
jgi:diaminopimelate epimerase